MTTMQAIDTEATLTPAGLAALKLAEEVTLHLNRDGSYMAARLRDHSYGGEPRIYTAREQRLFPETATSLGRLRRIPTDVGVYVYGNEGSTHDSGGWSYSGSEERESRPGCFYTWHDRDLVATVAGVLRAGDHLRLTWIGSNNNGYLKDAGLHADQVALVVPRGHKKLKFLLGVSVAQDNSARMIRRFSA